MAHAAEMLTTHPTGTQVRARDLADCIEALLDCAQACTACADACLATKELGPLVPCARSSLDWMLAISLLDTCLHACEVCADECEAHSDMHEHCRVCFEACQRCAGACRRLMGALPGPTDIY